MSLLYFLLALVYIQEVPGTLLRRSELALRLPVMASTKGWLFSR